MRYPPLFGITLLLGFQEASIAQQCQLNVNMPPSQTNTGYPVAWPKVGWRAANGSQWVTMNGTNSVKFVFCGTGTNCWFGPGDYAFTSSMKDAMRQAFTNWTNSKTANNSSLTFYEGTTSAASDYFYVDVRRIDVGGMGSASGLTHQNMGLIDSNNDGAGDTYRLVSAYIDISSTVNAGSYLTFVMAHETGHTMALDNCTSCTIYTTVMGTGQYTLNSTDSSMPLGPSGCDSQQVKQTAFP